MVVSDFNLDNSRNQEGFFPPSGLLVLEPSFGLVGNPLRLVSYDPEFQFQALPNNDDE